MAIAARKLTREGRDPIAVKNEEQAALKVERLKTSHLQASCRLPGNEHVDSSRTTSTASNGADAGNLRLPGHWRSAAGSIDSAVVLQTLLPVWKRVPETGSRLRGRIERVFAWAKAHKLFDGENPASRDVLHDALPVKAKAKHHAALPYADLPAFMVELASATACQRVA